jgi:hypothetical protein
MATCRITGTNEDVDTYDSAGGKDYSTLQGWEEATDIDCVAGTISPVLECYKGAHSDDDALSGATANATYFRTVRPASGEGHQGVPKSDGSIVEFHSTDLSVFDLLERNATLQDLCCTISTNSADSKHTVRHGGYDDTCIIGCLIYNCTNAGAGAAYGVTHKLDGANEKQFTIGCLIHNCKSRAINPQADGDANQDIYVYNCTITNNDIGMKYDADTDESVAINVISVNNTTDWEVGWTTTTCTSEGEAGVVFRDSANDDFHLDAIDTVARGQGTNLSADIKFAFDDDINDRVMGGAKPGQSIVGSWSIGFDQYVQRIKIS